MPALFAHYYFGCEGIENLPDHLAEICQRHRALFDLGLHGPDIFFYYKPLKSNAVTRFGSRLHRVSGNKVFSVFARRFHEQKNLSLLEKEQMLAYLLGFVGHFAFDSTAHAYIEEVPELYGISHNSIESLYDGYLMQQQGLDPIRTNRADFIDPSREAAACIARFFAFPEKVVCRSIMGQKRSMKLLYSPFEVKKYLLRLIIRTFHLPGGFSDLFVDRKLKDSAKQKDAETAIEEIDWLRKVAAERYPLLANSFIHYLSGVEELDELFRYDFEGTDSVSLKQ